MDSEFPRIRIELDGISRKIAGMVHISEDEADRLIKIGIGKFFETERFKAFLEEQVFKVLKDVLAKTFGSYEVRQALEAKILELFPAPKKDPYMY